MTAGVLNLFAVSYMLANIKLLIIDWEFIKDLSIIFALLVILWRKEYS